MSGIQCSTGVIDNKHMKRKAEKKIWEDPVWEILNFIDNFLLDK